jgi:hypothetical protein
VHVTNPPILRKGLLSGLSPCCAPANEDALGLRLTAASWREHCGCVVPTRLHQCYGRTDGQYAVGVLLDAELSSTVYLRQGLQFSSAQKMRTEQLPRFTIRQHLLSLFSVMTSLMAWCLLLLKGFPSSEDACCRAA